MKNKVCLSNLISYPVLGWRHRSKFPVWYGICGGKLYWAPLSLGLVFVISFRAYDGPSRVNPALGPGDGENKAIVFEWICDLNLILTQLVDPTFNEEAIMKGRMTVTLNTNGDVCSIQKAGGVGVLQSVVTRCLRIASVKAADITSKIKNAVRFHY